jgi:myosin-9
VAELPPHIFAVVDAAYHCMPVHSNSGESGSGKVESTNFLLHHLTALSQKGSYGSGVEQTILSAGPVPEVSVSPDNYIHLDCSAVRANI